MATVVEAFDGASIRPGRPSIRLYPTLLVLGMLRRYWFTFESSESPIPMNSGSGVTAYDYEDALTLMREKVFHGHLPSIRQCTEDVDVASLDARHVIPNLGNVLVRGVWFPLGSQ
jgi:hypothetical protein